MNDLIKALQIFLKYENSRNPIQCEHDVIYICLEDVDAVSEEDIETLRELGFIKQKYAFISYRFGSC